jgi:hypothetical protein
MPANVGGWQRWKASPTVLKHRDYIEWLQQLPVNRGARRSSWIGVYRSEQGFESFEAWQARINERDAPKGLISRWLKWMN